MNLTQDYRLVTAVFETPLSHEEKIGYVEGSPSDTTIRLFTVGDFVYRVVIEEAESTGTYNVEFSLVTINQEGQELIDTMEKIYKRELTLYEARYFRDGIRYTGYRWGVLGVGGAFRVMSGVLQIVKSFADAYPDAVKCLVFTATEKSRISLYSSMVKKLFHDYHTSEENDPYGINPDMVKFRVCRD
jgi:hypothetical protein